MRAALAQHTAGCSLWGRAGGLGEGPQMPRPRGRRTQELPPGWGAAGPPPMRSRCRHYHRRRLRLLASEPGRWNLRRGKRQALWVQG